MPKHLPPEELTAATGVAIGFIGPGDAAVRAWLFQDFRQKKRLGEEAPWSVGWYDPDGKKRSTCIGSKSLAGKFQRKIEGQLAAGTYQAFSRKQWSDFRQEYEKKIVSGLEPGTQLSVKIALDHFERLTKPKLIRGIRTSTIDDYIAARRLERGLRKGSRVSPATINKELRHLRAALHVACDYKYLAEMPKIRMVKEPDKLPTYVTPEHFASIYKACSAARLPAALPFTPSDWWQALLVFIYMTGWRIGEPLALQRDDVDLEAGTAVTRHGDNKGDSDELVPLHPVVVEHLKKIVSFEPFMFPWYHPHRALWEEFTRIQQAAGIHLNCHGQHEHTESCHVYGFHDLRRAFATVNAETLTADELQKLMRHKDYTTTKRYINMARRLNRTADKLFVPEVLRDQIVG